MSTISHFSPASPALLRAIWRGSVAWALPAVVVQDSPGLVALFWRAGTWGKGVTRRVKPAELLAPAALTPVDWQWTRTDVLALIRPGESHSVYLMRAGGWAEQDCWYINLQEPLRRSPLGFDTMDQMLDVVVSPDFSRWRWKDEDEFAEGTRIGIYSPAQAGAIRAEGERAVRLLLGERRAFFEAWQRWTPPAEWQIPSLPEEWDQI
ncbi:MAG TPA: DUF402 domain-containing protein [Anaerolineaceae bacterium]|nr:DUF402 domain-containing protein [Anaerolineaceae bacterium]